MDFGFCSTDHEGVERARIEAVPRWRPSDAQAVELTAPVAPENMRSRSDAALGLKSQGFKAT